MAGTKKNSISVNTSCSQEINAIYRTIHSALELTHFFVVLLSSLCRIFSATLFGVESGIKFRKMIIFHPFTYQDNFRYDFANTERAILFFFFFSLTFLFCGKDTRLYIFLHCTAYIVYIFLWTMASESQIFFVFNIDQYYILIPNKVTVLIL